MKHSQPLPCPFPAPSLPFPLPSPSIPPPLPSPCCGTGCLSGILRELVGEFSLSTNISATTTSLMKTLVDFDVGMVLEAWSRETDHQTLEQQVHMQSTNATQDCRHHKELSSISSLPLPSPPLAPLPSPPSLPLPSPPLDPLSSPPPSPPSWSPTALLVPAPLNMTLTRCSPMRWVGLYWALTLMFTSPGLLLTYF